MPSPTCGDRAAGEWWSRQSLRARLTLLATALFSFAVITGAVLLLVLQRYALTRVLDQSAATKTARDISRQVRHRHPVPPKVVQPTTGGIAGRAGARRNDSVLTASQGADGDVPRVR